MEHFTVTAPTYEEAVRKVREQYGEQARIYAHERRDVRGLLGFKKRDEVHVSGYVLPDDAQAQNNSSYSSIIRELQEMRRQFPSRDVAGAFPHVEALEAILEELDFSSAFISYIRQAIKSEFSPEDMQDRQKLELFVLRLIAESVRCDEQVALHLPKIFGIIGPTGVGKTTTLAKIAAQQAHGRRKRRSIRIISIDSLRIGGREQIRTFGNLIDVPVDSVETPEELAKSLEKHADADLILIDTIGKSPRDTAPLREMQELLSVCPSAYWALAVSASTKHRDLKAIVRHFSPFGFRSLIFTKMDETDCVGNLISVLHEEQLKVLFLTTGQRVPSDLIIPKTQLFLSKLSGFTVDTEHL